MMDKEALESLRVAGAYGLDMSPGNGNCADAYEYIMTLHADLKAVAVALDTWDYATKNPTPSGDRLACSESVLRAVFRRRGVQEALKRGE